MTGQPAHATPDDDLAVVVTELLGEWVVSGGDSRASSPGRVAAGVVGHTRAHTPR